MRKGFTIIELCLGAIIVGMIVGSGFLTQSIMEAAKIDKFAHNLLEYERATNSFIKKYNAIPGDSGFFLPAGNGNGYLEPQEEKFFWQHLEQAKLLKEIDSKMPLSVKHQYNSLKLEFVLVLPQQEAILLQKKMGRAKILNIQENENSTEIIYPLSEL